MPPVRRLSNTAGGLILSAAVGRRIPDNQSGYRLIGRRLMAALLDSDEDGFAFEVEMIARCIALGLPIAWVPIRTIYAGEPSHIRPWRPFHRASCAPRATPAGSSAAADGPSGGTGGYSKVRLGACHPPPLRSASQRAGVHPGAPFGPGPNDSCAKRGTIQWHRWPSTNWDRC